MSDVPEECYEGEHDWGEPEDLGNDVWRVTCKRCGEEVEEVLIVKYWKHKTITVMGKTYPAVKAWGNISKCSECGDRSTEAKIMLSKTKHHGHRLTGAGERKP